MRACQLRSRLLAYDQDHNILPLKYASNINTLADTLLPPFRLDYQDTTNVDSKGIAFTIRSVFIIDPKKTIRLILSYPASTGRNTAEVLRVVDSLQTGDKHRVTTPINWVPGDDVIVHPSVKNDEAKTLFPDFKIIKPYLRTTPLPKEKTSANV